MEGIWEDFLTLSNFWVILASASHQHCGAAQSASQTEDHPQVADCT